jgi:hypothetical protein
LVGAIVPAGRSVPDADRRSCLIVLRQYVDFEPGTAHAWMNTEGADTGKRQLA